MEPFGPNNFMIVIGHSRHTLTFNPGKAQEQVKVRSYRMREKEEENEFRLIIVPHGLIICSQDVTHYLDIDSERGSEDVRQVVWKPIAELNN